MTPSSSSIPSSHAATPPSGAMTDALCPYLLAADGNWRAATPAREHRCTAVVPAAVLAPEKQRRLCLVADHASCATFLAASVGEIGLDGMAAPRRVPALRQGSRPLVRTAPLVLDHGRMGIVVPALRGDRSLAQVALLVLMGIAFVAILLARMSVAGPEGSRGPEGLPGGALASAQTPLASMTPVASPEAGDREVVAGSMAPVRTLVPTEVQPTPATEPTAEPTEPTAEPAGSPSTYKVKRGDTLSGIAGSFGITWQELAALNGIEDPARLKVGQVLQLP